MSQAPLEALRARWRARWPEAVALWSRFAQVREPRWCFSDEEAAQAKLVDSFAMIGLDDHTVVVNLKRVWDLDLADYPLEVLGHEVGHHVYCPGDLADQGRLLVRMRRALPTLESHAPAAANLYADLLINQRLRRSKGLRMAEVYQAMGKKSAGPPSQVWTLYMRIYELLWGLEKGALAAGQWAAALEADAQLGARLLRVYAKDWVRGGGRFAALLFPYLLEDKGESLQRLLAVFGDPHADGAQIPAGLSESEADEDDVMHPSEDPALGGKGRLSSRRGFAGGGAGQYREPFAYGQLLKALGLDLSDHEAAVAYYRERALPHLIPFPARVVPPSHEPLPEGSEVWDIGESISEIDWTETAAAGPRVMPGLTTRKRVMGTMDGALPEKIPLDLDLYVDCSGSMPNPQAQTSFLALAGAIMVLSALRAGARVQATLWSGPREFDTTDGFIRDETALLRILTGYLGGATAFPIHLLRKTYEARGPGERPAHILVISDDGVTTMFNRDEAACDGAEVAGLALAKARGGGTWCLNIHPALEQNIQFRQAKDMGWAVHAVRNWEELVAFAADFSRRHYGEKS